MKKALSILLTAALLLTCLAGCGGAGSASPSGTDTSGTSQSTAGANVPAWMTAILISVTISRPGIT